MTKQAAAVSGAPCPTLMIFCNQRSYLARLLRWCFSVHAHMYVGTWSHIFCVYYRAVRLISTEME